MNAFRNWIRRLFSERFLRAEREVESTRDDPAELVETRCINCAEDFTGHFCPVCGQERVDYRRSTKRFVKDIADDWLSLDSRLIRTIVPLLFKPGFLTNEYEKGRRIRYIKPLRIYIITSLLFFLVVNYVVDSALSAAILDDSSGEVLAASSLKAINDSTWTLTHDSTRVDTLKADVRKLLTENLRRNQIYLVRETESDSSSAGDSDSGSAVEEFSVSRARMEESVETDGRVVLKRVIMELLDRLPQVLFFMMPFFALLLKLLYIRGNRLYVEHIVFAFHVHAFIFLFMGAMLLVLSGSVHFFWSFPITAVYLVTAMRKVYGQGWLKTIIKSGLVFVMYTLLINAVALAATLLTATAFLSDYGLGWEELTNGDINFTW